MSDDTISSLEEAKDVLLKDARDREKACGDEINNVLDHCKCVIIPSVIVSPDGRLIAKIDIKAV